MVSRKAMKSPCGNRALAALGVGAAALYGARVLINVFGPQPPFAMQSPDVPLDSEEFIQFLSTVTDGSRRRSHLYRLKNGVEFFPAMLEAIQSARQAINIEFYGFAPGEVSRRFLDALSERARAGVDVRLIVDAVGSLRTPNSYFDGLRSAGGKVCWYHPLRWNTWPDLNQRTHRKLIVIDGNTGFIGGAGIADHWLHATRSGPAWRDTFFRIEGEATAGLVSTFAENWLEASGEILSGPRQFAFRSTPEGAECFVVISTPRGGGTGARVLFQALIHSAQHSIRITTPYFLPDPSARRAFVEARNRGVQIRILTAGPHIDHPIVHKLSLRATRHLMRAGAEIYDYMPAMIHAKLMTIDGQWSVVGSTNFDHRSFALNDEVNLAVLDRDLAAVIDSDFDEDLKQSRRLTEDVLGHRSPFSAIDNVLGRILRFES
ncbi:MAG TPA: phosphatidylserine/phosphatidylglycerophosphate/cardiolipin synthase family protein [Candidatus Acidoferrales bacterium]|nr:phosphatidylserine/phosphatidylglycerophosphate/cardiolipin synthase family protein [Candidatus Acidoferrales bacterium]